MNPTPMSITPQEPPVSQPSQSAKRWKLFQVATAFFFGVALIHKILVPLGLKTTHLATSEYAKLDPWIVLPLGFALWVMLKRKFRITGSLLGGGVIGYALIETYFTIRGEYSKWLIFSHLLSSIPMGVMAIVGMTFQDRSRKIVWAWLGALIVLSGKIWIDRPPEANLSNLNLMKNQPHPPNRYGDRMELSTCGAMNLRSSDVKPTPASQLLIESCGFKPNSLLLASERITIQNRTDRGVNIRYFILNGEKLKTAWNVFVPPGSSRESPPMSLGTEHVGMMMSDAVSDFGLTAVFGKEAKSEILFQREPPHMEVIR